MKEKTEIPIPLYGGNLIIIYCSKWSILKEDYTSLLKNYSLDESNDGYVFQNNNEFVVAFNQIPNGSTITHEVIHLVNNLFSERSISLDINNDEHQAYLAEWFFEQIEQFFKEMT